MVNIISVQLNPRFCSQEMFNDIKNQGIDVSWLEETESEKEQIFEITIPDDKTNINIGKVVINICGLYFC